MQRPVTNASVRLRPGALFLMVGLWLLWLLFPLMVHAGDLASTANDVPFHDAVEVARWQTQVTSRLEAEDVRIAIIARTGRSRDKLPEGMAYVHGAWLVREPALAPDGRVVEAWFTYQLFRNAEDKQASHLAIEPLGTFLAGSYEDDVGVLIPVPVLQTRLLEALRAHGAELRRPAYHLLANPHRTEFDNCNTWMLRLIFVAIYQTTDLPRIQANTEAYFVPQVVSVGFWTRFGGNIAGLLEPQDKGPEGYQTATFESLGRFLETQHLLQERHIFAIGTDK